MKYTLSDKELQVLDLDNVDEQVSFAKDIADEIPALKDAAIKYLVKLSIVPNYPQDKLKVLFVDNV